MSKLFKILSLAALLGAMLMAGGCGGGDAPLVTTPSATTSFAATVNPDGTATTGPNPTVVATAPGTSGYLATVSATLSPNTVITARNADGTRMALTAGPSFTFTASSDSSATFAGIVDVPPTSGFLPLTSTSGAVDVQLTGADSATFIPAITITMPVPGKAVGAVIDVYTVTGTTYSFLGSFTVTSAGLVSFPVSSLSWKVGDPSPKPSASTTSVQPTTAPTTAPTTIVPRTVPATTTTTVPAIDGAALYASTCQTCHGPLASPTRPIASRTVAGISSAGMAFGLSDAQLLAIIAVLP